MDIIISTSQHRVLLTGTKQWRKVDTHSAAWREGSTAVAHNFPSPEAAARALKTFRFALYQQGG